MAFSIVGSFYWTSGPLVIAPATLHARWVATFTKQDAAPLRRAKKAAAVTRIGKTPASLKVWSFVRPRGYLYIDYMLPMEQKHRERENFFARGALHALFPATEWHVLYDRVLPPLLEKAHVDNPVDHFHHWGHLLARRQRSPARRPRSDRRGAP